MKGLVKEQNRHFASFSNTGEVEGGIIIKQLYENYGIIMV